MRTLLLLTNSFIVPVITVAQGILPAPWEDNEPKDDAGTSQPASVHTSMAGSLFFGYPFFPDPFAPMPSGEGRTSHRFTRSANLTPFNPLFPTLTLQPRTFEINTPAGPISIDILPAASISSLVPRPEGDPSELFRPPSFFSAPLPTGSGARALGFSGAFSAIADDATAASWNPAGLLNLETPETSLVIRYSRTQNRHTSTDPDFTPKNSEYQSEGINYFSAVLPLYFTQSGRNVVISLNHQEAYDFEHRFEARVRDRNQTSVTERSTGFARGVQEDEFTFEDGRFEVSVLTTISTTSESVLAQLTKTELDSRLRFSQSGIIEASTPAIALEITPKLFLGAALNFYQDSPLPGRGILSKTIVDYRIRQNTSARVSNRQTTTATYETRAVEHVPGLPPFFPPFDVELGTETGSFPSFSDEQTTVQSRVSTIEGRYERTEKTSDLEGINSTLGALYTLNRFLVIAAAVDLPWEAEATQTRTTRNTLRENGGPPRVTESGETRKVSYDFPLFANAGVVLRLNDRFYTSLDVSYTRWSQFAFDGGDGRINPLTGDSLGEAPLKNTVSFRGGFEYLFLLDKTEIPLRFGLVEEERPAAGNPDRYRGFSAGTGVSLGRDPGKLIFDVAYSYLEADDVQTVIPEQRGLRTDTRQHQVFLSVIWHLP